MGYFRDNMRNFIRTYLGCRQVAAGNGLDFVMGWIGLSWIGGWGLIVGFVIGSFAGFDLDSFDIASFDIASSESEFSFVAQSSSTYPSATHTKNSAYSSHSIATKMVNSAQS